MPLCSTTKSGKLIQRIIKEGGFTNVLKTNLYDVDYLPNDDERFMLGLDWVDRINPNEDDVLVLLGRFVQDHFPPHSSIELRIAHPASKRSHTEMDEYIYKTITLLREYFK